MTGSHPEKKANQNIEKNRQRKVGPKTTVPRNDIENHRNQLTSLKNASHPDPEEMRNMKLAPLPQGL